MKNRKRMIAFLAAAALIFSIGAVKIFPVAVQACLLYTSDAADE